MVGATEIFQTRPSDVHSLPQIHLPLILCLAHQSDAYVCEASLSGLVCFDA